MDRRQRIMDAMHASYFRVRLTAMQWSPEICRRAGAEIRAQVRMIRLLRGGSPWQRGVDLKFTGAT